MDFRGLNRWLLPYLRQARRRRAPRRGEHVHLLLCIADHYEPRNGGADAQTARQRVIDWEENYPRNLGELRDSDGRPPRHSFFYPMEQYLEEEIDRLGNLCTAGYGEIEIHLHHDNDNSAALRQKLLRYCEILSIGHGMLARDRDAGTTQYGFIHGDWALDNSLPDGSCCGVNDELTILRETGCYADFTLPSAPSPAQTKKINSIYYAVDDPNRPRSHDDGIDLGRGQPPADALLLIQGPLLLNWSKRKWRIVPRVENGCVQANQAMSIERLPLWLRARVQAPARPDWFFVKLHTHGAPEANARMLMGDPAIRFHRDLAQRASADPTFHYHYVSAREMYNLARAAEAGWTGSVHDALDYRLLWNAATPIRAAAPASSLSFAR